jgi:hypothetical protein
LPKNCLLKHVIEGRIEGKRSRGRRFKQQLDDLKQKRSDLNYFRLPPRSRWDITQCMVVILTDFSGKLSIPSSRVKKSKKVKTLEDRTHRLSRNVGKKLPLYIA